MTVPSTTRRAGPYLGNGATTAFPFSFKVFSASDIALIRTDVNGISYSLVLDTDYSVALNPDQDSSPGGTITYPLSGAPLGSGETLVGVGALPYDQTTDLPPGGPYRAQTVETAFDRTVYQIQQLAEGLGRALTLPPAATGVDTELPAPEAGHVIGWNADADELVNYSPADLATVVLTGTSYFQTYNGDGVTTQFVLPADPGSVNALDIALGGVVQKNGIDFTVSGTTLTFTSPPPAGTGNIAVRFVAALPGGAGSAQDITFTQAGAGAVQRTVQLKLQEFVSVADFGALGNGVTDDTATIQKALDAGLCVDFGDNTKNYRVSGTLTVRSYATLRGAGARIFQVARQTPLFNCVGKTDVLFTGLNMTGAPMSTVAAGAFEVGKVYSIVSAGTTDFTLIGAANNTPGTFFTATGPGTGTGVASTFYNTPNSQDIGIKADRATNLTVAFCTFNGFAYSPLMVALWGTNIRFLHNVVVGPGYSVLNPLGVPDPQVPGFRNCTGVTILGYGVEVHGNQFSDTSQGVYIGQQSRDVTVSSNNVLNTIVEHGMYCDTGCQRVRVVHNTFSNCKLIGAKAQWYDATVAATALIVGGLYVIQSVGTTDFTLVGAASNTVGLEFKATAAGTGTGVCRLPTPQQIVFAHNTIDTVGGDGLLAINAGTANIATITGVTAANPAVFTTAAAHGLAVGDLIDVASVGGMTPVNSSWRVSAVPTGTTFRVRTPAGELDSSAFPAYTSGGVVRRPVYGRSIIFSNNTLRNVGQDCISARYCDGLNIDGNIIETGARVGIYQLITLNGNTHGNVVRDTQQNGIYCYSPIDQNSIYDNTLLNVGAAGVDTGGASSGIFAEGDGGGIIEGNIVQGELTRTKMLYGIQLGSGDKTQWSIDDNQVYDAESAIVALHGLDNKSLRSFDGNIGTAASGPDALTGLATALPNRGNPRPDWWGNAAPTTGTWAQGSKVWKILPAAGDPLGWVNVASGTPGTWQPMGVVHAVAATQALQGTYTPTCTAATNITGGTGGVTMGTVTYSVYGNYCTVRGYVLANVTTAGTTVTFRLTLPIAATLGTADTALTGVVTSRALNTMISGGVTNNGTDNEAAFSAFVTDANGNARMNFEFTYKLA